MNILIDKDTMNRHAAKAEETRMVNSSEAIMKCGDYSEEDSRCSRGIPVSPLFGHYICSGRHEDCPIRLWVKSLRVPANVIRPRKTFIAGRKK